MSADDPGAAGEAAAPASTAPRWLRRPGASPGIIDVAAAHTLHARSAGWALQRIARSSGIAARYASTEQAAGGDLPLARASVVDVAEAPSTPAPGTEAAVRMPVAASFPTAAASPVVASSPIAVSSPSVAVSSLPRVRVQRQAAGNGVARIETPGPAAVASGSGPGERPLARPTDASRPTSVIARVAERSQPMASSARDVAPQVFPASESVNVHIASRPAAAPAIASALPSVTPRGEASVMHHAAQGSLTLQRKADHGGASRRDAPGVNGSPPGTGRSETDRAPTAGAQALRAGAETLSHAVEISGSVHRTAPALVWRTPDAAAIAARAAQTANAGSSPRLMRAATDAPANLAASPAAHASVASASVPSASVPTAANAIAHAPALDIDRIADRVLRLIAGRLRVERERRGEGG